MSESKEESVAKEVDEFDYHLNLLLQTSFAVHDKKHSRNQQLWMTWANRFFTTYTAAKSKKKKLDGFKKMFQTFFEKNREAIEMPIFEEKDEETVVNDDWLKTRDYLDGPGFKGKQAPVKQKGSWTPMVSRCRGHVIYLSWEKKEWTAISIPISEIYRSATLLYEDKADDNSDCASYPGKILMCFYGILVEVISKEDPSYSTLHSNFTALREFVSQIASDDGSPSGTGINNLGEIMSKVMKSAGLEDGINEKSISNLVDKVKDAVGPDTVKKAGDALGKFAEAINGDDGEESKDIGTVISKVGKVIASEEFIGAVRGAAEPLQAATKSLANSVPTKDNPQAQLALPAPEEQD